MQNIAAYTAPTVPDNGYVEFISINRAGEHDELVQISVRDRGPGNQIFVAMTKADFALLLIEAMKNL